MDEHFTIAKYLDDGSGAMGWFHRDGTRCDESCEVFTREVEELKQNPPSAVLNVVQNPPSAVLNVVQKPAVSQQSTDRAAVDRLSHGRTRSEWKELNSKLTDKLFEGIRKRHPDLVVDFGGQGKGPWQFYESLCKGYNLKCPEFDSPEP